MQRYVEISFDCLPLRSVGRIDIPLDASPAFRAHCERVQAAIAAHGTHNTYFLYNARCVFHLTNDPRQGMLDFSFTGTALTDQTDQKTVRCVLDVVLEQETCDWLTAPIVDWFRRTVEEAVRVEFDRYIQAGDLQKTRERIERMQRESDDRSGYLGMYL
jgi:hypothetical protein